MPYYKDPEFSSLIGKTLVEITGAEQGSDNLTLTTLEGNKYRLNHDQDCCESVRLEEVVGDINDILNTPILDAYEESNSDGEALTKWDESYTWTFYRITTVKGTITLRWYGTSNGYYSERVTFREVK